MPTSASDFDDPFVIEMGGQIVDATTWFPELASAPHIDELRNVDMLSEVTQGNSKTWTGAMAKFKKVALGLRSYTVRRQQQLTTTHEGQVDLVAYELLQFVGFEMDTFEYL